MEKRKENPPYLTKEEQGLLYQIDLDLETALKGGNNNAVQDLIKQRQNFLTAKKQDQPSIMQRIIRAAEARDSYALKARTWARLGIQMMGWFGNAGMNTAMPDWIRKMIDVPVAFVWGENDAYSPEEEARKKQLSERVDRMQHLQTTHKDDTIESIWAESAYFPHSPLIIDASVSGRGHVGMSVDTARGAEQVIDIVERMFAEEKTLKPNQQQKTMRLSY